MWGGAIYYNKSAYPALVNALSTFCVSGDENASIIVATSYISGMGEVGVSNLYYTLPVASPPALEPFTKVQPQIGTNTLRIDSLLGFAREQEAFATKGARQWFFTTSFRVDVQFMLDIHPLWLAAVAKVEAAPGLMFSLVFQPVTQGLITQSLTRGPNSLGLEVSDGPFVVCLINTVHANPSDDDLVSATVLDLLQLIDALAAARELGTKYRFLNYGYETQKILEGYGEASIEHLKAVSKKYDPSGFFQTMVPGGFKISKVDI